MRLLENYLKVCTSTDLTADVELIKDMRSFLGGRKLKRDEECTEPESESEGEKEEFGAVLYVLPEALDSDASNSPDDGKCKTVAVSGWSFDKTEVSEDAVRLAFQRIAQVPLNGLASTTTPAGDQLYVLTFQSSKDALRGLRRLRGAKIVPKSSGDFEKSRPLRAWRLSP